MEVQCRNSVSSDLSIAADGPAYSTGGTQLKLEEFMYEIRLLHRIQLGLELTWGAHATPCSRCCWFFSLISCCFTNHKTMYLASCVSFCFVVLGIII